MPASLASNARPLAAGGRSYDPVGGLPGSVSGQGVAMEFRILGSFEVVGSEGLVDLSGAKRRGVLAFLVVHAGQPVSIDRLVEELWGDAGSDSAARTVQTYVSQLRKLLKGEGASVQTRPAGYALEVDPEQVDAFRFEQGVAAASAEPDAAQRLAMIDEALVLWRGRPLGEFTGAGWADREATRLEALHLRALQRRYDSLLALDLPADAVAELETLVQTHPLDERLWAQLMLALYRSGRQADALGAYRQARRQLVDQLGIEPGPELAELEHRILDHDPMLVTPAGTRVVGYRRANGASGVAEGWYPRTFLLTDIVDSVSMWEHEPGSMAQAVARHEALIRDAVDTAGGEIVRTKGEGDSTFSVFPHPWDAVTAAASIQEVIASESWRSATPLRVRVGVHTGDAEPRDGDWYGPAVNRAARLRALADGGQALLSGVTAGLVADQMPNDRRLLYRGRRVLRGIERPEEVWELVAVDDLRLATLQSVRVGDLPVALTRFVGRVAELDDLAEIVRHERLVTLTGPGGSGKTRLALEVVQNSQARGERVWLAELASLRDPGLVAQVVANAVGVETGPDPLAELLAQGDALAGVLVLDNCEHLLEACAGFTEQLLAAAPGVQVLATSREPLGLTGEREWPVRPLDVPDESLRDRDQLTRVESVRLLLDRGRAVRPRLEVGHDDVASVVQICRVLDGIPLAIELAAGRLRALNLADLSLRLGDALNLLVRHRSTGRDDPRHRTLRATLDWSYDLLTYDQQTLARRLSVFAGGFRLDGIEAVCGGALDVLDGIDELVAKSLVTFDPVTARYRLLEPLRQYLAERLQQSGEDEATRRLHAEWVAGMCHQLGSRLLEDQKARSSRLREETANIEQTLRWTIEQGEHDIAVRIVGSLGQYWFFNDQATARRWCGPVIENSVRVPPRRRAKALLSAGMMAQNDQEWDQSVAWLREALAIFRAEHALPGQAASLFALGRALDMRCDANIKADRVRGADPARATDTTEARDCFDQSLYLFMQLGGVIGASWCRIWLTFQALRGDDLDRAEELSQQVIADCVAAGVRHPVGDALHNLASIAHQRGRHDVAVEYLQSAVALYRELGDPWLQAGLLVDLAAQTAMLGQGAQALQALAESIRLDDQIGRLPGRSYTLGIAAVVHLARADTTLSIAALGAFDAHPIRGTLRTLGPLLADTVDATRRRLDPAAVASSAAGARAKQLDDLIDELILQPARTA
jgi:predicted ATPase/DNA-binding SARP family transcriptional activator/class 3 adenylate cyclase